MSTTITRFSALGLCLMFVVGCSGTFVAKQKYEDDVQALKDYSNALERRNRDLEAEVNGLRKVTGELSIISKENEFYTNIARQIETWLAGSQIPQGDVTFKDGKWTMAGDMLFQSGSYTITPKGKDVLQKIATAYKTNTVRFRIVGHTDRDPVVKASTRKSLQISKDNPELSVMRALAVYDQLKSNGINESRMIVVGMGNSSPVAANDRNPVNKKKNRRVEIQILEGVPGK